MADWERERGFDVALTLECHEFAALFTNRGMSCRRDDVDAYLEAIAGPKQRFEIGHVLVNAPTLPGFYYGQASSKTFVTAGSSGDGIAGTPPRATELTCVSVRHRVAATPSREPVAGKLLVGIPALSATISALGVRNDLFGLSNGDEDGTLPDALPILLPAPKRRHREAAAFDGHQYLELNPDVAVAGWPPLKHFIIHGHAEKRRYAVRNGGAA